MRAKPWAVGLIGLGLAAQANVAATHEHDEHDALVERGAYLAQIMDRGGCHTPGYLRGAPDFDRYLAGSDVGFGGPFGVVYPPNLTPDDATGLGRWSVEDIMAAVRSGTRPDGSELHPIMPWPSYGHLTDEDARALATYLKSLEPISNETPAPVADPAEATAPYLTLAVPE